MNSNSITVYFDKVQPKISERQGQVLKTVSSLKKCTIYQAASALGVFPNQISGRFTELAKKEILKIVGKKLIDNRPHNIYALNIK